VPLALLTYLHAAPGRCARREHLAATFWANSDSPRARQALRKNLSRLRNVLGGDAFDDRLDEVCLARSVASDRDDFLDAIARNDPAAAVAIYGGPFFSEFGSPGAAEFEHWADAERARLAIMFLRAAEAAVRDALDRGRGRDMIELGRRVQAEAPDSELGARLVLEVLLAAREEAAAAAEADRIIRWLAEAGRTPEPATSRLLRFAREGSESEPPESDGLTPELIGREREFHVLLSAWRDVVRGRVRSFHVEGGAGLGKTRLLQEVAGRIQTLGGRVVQVGARPGERLLAFSFAADVAKALGSLPGAKGIGARTAALLVGLHPELGSAFPGIEPATGEPDQAQQRALALGDLLAAVSAEAAIALMLDDVHWADAASAQVVGAAIARLGSEPVLTVTAGRPGRSGVAGGDVPRLLLKPLTLSDTEGLLATLGTFPDPAAGRRLAAIVHRVSGGSPLLMLEGLALALEQGRLSRGGGVWQLPDGDALTVWFASLDPVEERLRSLSAPARDLLLTLAATGAPLALGDIERAIGTGVLSQDTIAELERRGYVAARGEQWDLAHDKVGEAVVRLAGEPERQRAHAALGRALLARGAGDTRVSQRAARHLVEGDAGADLARLFRDRVTAARERGDWASASRLARELLGDLATPRRVRLLNSSLPWVVRFPILGWFMFRGQRGEAVGSSRHSPDRISALRSRHRPARSDG